MPSSTSSEDSVFGRSGSVGNGILRPDSQLSLFLRYEARLLQFAAELGAGPWMLNITASGVRSMPIRP